MLLGFDIGGTKCAIVLGRLTADGKPEVIEKIALATQAPAGEMIDLLWTTADALMEKNGVQKEHINGIGIACGGPLNSKTGVILSPPNLQGWDNVPIAALAEERYGRKAILQNDANACAIAEWKYGAGKGREHIVFLTFGTGMGAGLILNGRLYGGANDLAGEIGHMRLLETGPVGYGKAGSFEGFCSGGGIAQLAQIKARELLQMGKKAAFCDDADGLGRITAKAVAEAAYAGDAAAIDVYRTCGRYLGKGLAVLMDLLNPEAIILGGIYCKAQPLLEPEMRKALEQEALPGAYSGCEILPAALGEYIGDVAVLALAAGSAAHNM